MSTETLSYRHDAFFYAGIDEFTTRVGKFVQDGVVGGEAVLVVVSAQKIERLRSWLGPEAAGRVEFVDMAEAGRNPARIIALWREWVDQSTGTGRALRGVGEPVYPERAFEELMECSRHEALLNLAFDQAEPFWLLCPYDVSVLEAAVVEEARRNHPWWVEGGERGACAEYVEVDTAHPFAQPLPPMPVGAEVVSFAGADMRTVRELVSRHARAAGFSSDQEWDLVVAMNELATNSVQHGGGTGTARVWNDGARVVCEVVDAGLIDTPLIGRLPPDLSRSSGRGLWIANQLCDLVQLHSGPSGTVVRIHMRADA
ncbi:MAG TPA: sensor histidine kinase [Acidimicrobiales bacterium]|nr:sensor histidine kinase [Acidimicrobiales bacterium]